MSDDINVMAESRNVFGKGASRRLRRENLVPAILYGDNKDPKPVQLKHNQVVKHLESEGFYSQLLMVAVDGGEPARCILKDVQRHPFRQQILHMDFLRVTAGAELTVNVPLHFLNEESSPGVKNENGIVTHNDNEVAIACRPRDIPAHIEVDMGALAVGDAIHLSDLTVPENVRLVDLIEKGDDSDRVVASIQAPRVEIEPEEEVDAAEAGDVPTTGDDAAEGEDGGEESSDD